MKPNHPSAGKDPLGNLLQEWRVEAELPPRFEEQVWRRIAVEETRAHESGWRQRFRNGLELLFARPAFASACVIALLMVGVTAGWFHGQRESARLDAKLGWRYVQSIDPYLASRH